MFGMRQRRSIPTESAIGEHPATGDRPDGNVIGTRRLLRQVHLTEDAPREIEQAKRSGVAVGRENRDRIPSSTHGNESGGLRRLEGHTSGNLPVRVDDQQLLPILMNDGDPSTGQCSRQEASEQWN